MQNISIKGILQDLTNGLTRTTTSQGYDATVGSIETKYELSKADVGMMFKHPLLMNKKTRKAPAFTLVDDVTPTQEEVVPVQAAPAYGARPAGSSIPVEEPTLVSPTPTQTPEEIVVAVEVPVVEEEAVTPIPAAVVADF